MTPANIISALVAAVVTRIPAGETATRFITAPCRACGTVASVLATRVTVSVSPWSAALTDSGALLALLPADTSRVIVPCACGTLLVGRPVVGKVNEAKGCNDRCMSATRHVCECECGGLNHGASHGG